MKKKFSWFCPILLLTAPLEIVTIVAGITLEAAGATKVARKLETTTLALDKFNSDLIGH